MINNNELKQIIGGTITATFLGYIVRGINSILDLGRSIGTAIRRIQTGKLCSL